MSRASRSVSEAEAKQSEARQIEARQIERRSKRAERKRRRAERILSPLFFVFSKVPWWLSGVVSHMQSAVCASSFLRLSRLPVVFG